MIRKSIRNPKPHRIFGFIPYHQRNKEREEDTVPHTNLLPSSSPVDISLGRFPSQGNWDKIKYARWVESVKKSFHVGQLVTNKAIHTIPGKVPYHFRVVSISEVMQQVRWDQVAWEPKAVTVQFKSGGIIDNKAPSTLRPLTKEECDLVALQNTEPQGCA